MKLTKQIAYIYENGYILNINDIVSIRVQIDDEKSGNITGRVKEFTEKHLSLDCSSGYVSDVKVYRHSSVLDIEKEKS